MPRHLKDLPTDLSAFVAAVQAESAELPVLVLKFSPTCPISHGAEERYRDWIEGVSGDVNFATVELDVIEQRELARGLTAELGIKHESPQALVIQNGEVLWHDSHRALTSEAFADALQVG